MRLVMKVPSFMDEDSIMWWVWFKMKGPKYGKVSYELQCTLTPRERTEAQKQLKCMKARMLMRKIARKR